MKRVLMIVLLGIIGSQLNAQPITRVKVDADPFTDITRSITWESLSGPDDADFIVIGLHAYYNGRISLTLYNTKTCAENKNHNVTIRIDSNEMIVLPIQCRSSISFVNTIIQTDIDNQIVSSKRKSSFNHVNANIITAIREMQQGAEIIARFGDTGSVMKFSLDGVVRFSDTVKARFNRNIADSIPLNFID